MGSPKPGSDLHLKLSRLPEGMKCGWLARYTPYVEPLGPYALLEDETVQTHTPRVYRGQDTRTGIPVLVYPEQPGPLPPSLLGCLPWIEAMDGSWVAELPMGAVPGHTLGVPIESQRLTFWARCLVQAVQNLEEDGLIHGALTPDRIWTKGNRVWIEGMGLPPQSDPLSDRLGVLHILQHWADRTWAALPWATEAEDWATRSRPSEALIDALTALLPTSKTQIRVPTLRPAAPGEVDGVPTAPVPPPVMAVEAVPSSVTETPVSAPEIPVWGPAELRTVPESTDPESADVPMVRRIRIEDSGMPSFPIYEPPSRRALTRLPWTWIVVAMLLVAGIGAGFWWRNAQSSPGAVGASVVRFEVFPEGSQAKLVVVEAPPGSSLADRIGEVFAEIPGPVTFDSPGQYLLSVRSANREPQEFALTVPKPGGIRIRLR